MTDPKTEARAVARWTRDAEGWVEWPDGEWVRYSDHATALAAKDAELAKRPDWATVNATYEKWKARAERAEAELARRDMQLEASAKVALDLSAQLAEARKALGMMLKEHDILSGNFGDVMDPKHKRPDRWPTAAEAARRALTGGQEE